MHWCPKNTLTRHLGSTSTSFRLYDHILLVIVTRFRVFPTNRFNARFMVATCLVAWLLAARWFNAWPLLRNRFHTRLGVTAWLDAWILHTHGFSARFMIAAQLVARPWLTNRLHTRYFPVVTFQAWETASEADAFLLRPLNEREREREIVK